MDCNLRWKKLADMYKLAIALRKRIFQIVQKVKFAFYAIFILITCLGLASLFMEHCIVYYP